MLSQIVRPMVRTQLRLLASSQATRTTLVNTISQWLGFIGVEAHVTNLEAASDQIQVSLRVGKPDGCDPKDWQQIIDNLQANQLPDSVLPTTADITSTQRSKLQRLLAYVIQVGNPDGSYDWDVLQSQLTAMGFDTEMTLGIRSALKVPQNLDTLMEGLDPDVAAIALPKAVSIALFDRQVNAREDKALSGLLDTMKAKL